MKLMIGSEEFDIKDLGAIEKACKLAQKFAQICNDDLNGGGKDYRDNEEFIKNMKRIREKLGKV